MKRADGPRVFEASFCGGATSAASLPPPEIPEVAFAGRSNVGKSSLLNVLLDRKALVRTSRTPGCTRQVNVFDARLEEDRKVRLVDLPGYGYAHVSKREKTGWGAMLEGYLAARTSLRAVVLLVDVRRGFEAEEIALLEFLASCEKTRAALLVATKLDKLPRAHQKPALTNLQRHARHATGGDVLGFSAVTREGRAELWARILQA